MPARIRPVPSRAPARVAQAPRAWVPRLRALASARAAVPPAAAGSLLCLAAVATAFLAQRLLTSAGSLDRGRILFGLAALAALAGILLIDRVAPLRKPAGPDVRLEPWRWTSTRSVAAVSLVVLGSAASLATIPLVERSGADRPALALWLAAIALVVAGTAVGARNRIRFVRPSRAQALQALPVAAVLGIALALRAPQLADLPAFVHGDEAAIGNEGRRIMAGGSMFEFGWYGLPSLSYAIASATLWLFGNDLTGLRAASVIQGTLSVLFLYLIVRRLFGSRPALLAAFLLAVSQWDIHFSRQGSHYMQAQLATLLVLYLLLRALDTRRALDYLLCGLAIGLCFEVYFAARLAPAIAGLVLVHRALDDRSFLRRQWLGLAALVLGVVVFLAPMWPAASAQPDVVNGRFRSVSLLQSENMRIQMQDYAVDSWIEVLKKQTLLTVEAFNRVGETSLQYGRQGPLLDFWTASLLPLGVLLVLFRIREPGYFLLSGWVVLTLVYGSILTNTATFSPRIIAVIPALMILPALVIDAVWRGLGGLRGWVGAAFAVPVAAFGALAFQANFRSYFHHERPEDFHTVLAHHLRSQGPGYRYYLIGVDGPSLRYETPRFFVPDVDGLDVGDGPLPLPVSPVPRGKGLDFLVDTGAADAEARLRAIRHAYPVGLAREHADRNGLSYLTSYVVSHREAVRRAR